MSNGRRGVSSPYGLHRSTDGLLPQASTRLDVTLPIWDDETLVEVDMLNLDAASYRQLREAHTSVDGHFDGVGLRASVLAIIEQRGKMQNPVTGSGGMLIGTVREVGSRASLGLSAGDRVATLVSLSLTPLSISDGLVRWDARSEHVPARGHAILFGRSIAAVLPSDLDERMSLMVMDVCGAPALVRKVVTQRRDSGHDAPSVIVLGGAGKSGSLALAAARDAGAGRVVAVVPTAREADLLGATALADDVVVADARDPLGLLEALAPAGGPGDVVVVCVDVPGCEQPAILATAAGGTVVYFSMATSFAAAALGAEGLAADVTMLVGNGYTPGHAAYALALVRDTPDVRTLFESRLVAEVRS